MADTVALFLLTRREDTPPADMDIPVFTKDPGPTVVALTWSVGAISTIFLFLRVYCKQVKAKGLWWDDYLLIVAWVCGLLTSFNAEPPARCELNAVLKSRSDVLDSS